jgi:hypothetical protein
VALRLRTEYSAPAGADLPGYTQLRLDAFMFPCILAILLRSNEISGWFIRAITPGKFVCLVFGLGAGIALGAVWPAWREPQRLVQSAILPVIIAATALRPLDWAGRLLSHPALEWLGRISYSVYLWQQLVFGFAPARGLARVFAAPVLIGAILALAWLSWRWIETPAIALGKRLANPGVSRLRCVLKPRGKTRVPELESGLSLARNDACAAITRSMFPACFLRSAPNRDREERPSGAPALFPIPTPLRAPAGPSGSKRSTGPNAESSSRVIHSPSGSLHPLKRASFREPRNC